MSRFIAVVLVAVYAAIAIGIDMRNRHRERDCQPQPKPAMRIPETWGPREVQPPKRTPATISTIMHQ